jgi:hypothetical protein
MGEAELASDLLVILASGVQTNKSIETLYRRYEGDSGKLETHAKHFDSIMSYIGETYSPEDLANTNWARVQLFYSLFSALAHGLIGVTGLDSSLRPTTKPSLVGKWRNRLDEISSRYDEYTQKDNGTQIPKTYSEFIDRSRRRTTDTASRVYRGNFICRQLRSI